jgi:DNA-binding transcriptional LysR family regulator
MRLDHTLLRTFVAAIDAMSFTRAAQAVHKSPATVSTQIARLEQEIGAPLFTRDTRNLALTRAGEELEPYARRLLALHDEAVAALRQPEIEGSITIGAPDDYITHLLPPVLRRFGLLFPRVEIKVVCAQSTALTPQIEAGEIDLAIVTRVRGEGQLLRREPMVWIASRDRLALTRRPLPVALFEPGSQARAVVLAALTRSEIRFRPAYESFNQSALFTIVEAGLAVAAVTRMSAPPGLALLDGADGLPAVERLEVALIRRAGSNDRLGDAMAKAILEGSAAELDQNSGADAFAR